MVESCYCNNITAENVTIYIQWKTIMLYAA